jgi:transposase
MAKRKYRAIQVKDVSASRLKESLSGRCVVAIDVAKEDFFAAVMDESREVRVTVKWKHPEQSGEFVRFVSAIADVVELDVAMEPTGVYGDAVRACLLRAGHTVYRVSPKRAHDMAEVYDGVPSWHDAKSAAIIGKLHLDEASEPWPVASDHERRLKAALRVLDLHYREELRNRNRLEAVLARHWPELTRFLDAGSATVLELLTAYGGPASVAADPSGARKLMRSVGGRFLTAEKVEAILTSANTTFGMGQIDEEVRLVQVIAGECQRQRRASKAARRRVEQLSAGAGSSQHMAPVVGKTTAAVLTASVGEATRYESAAAYEKSFGLNLKEKSSGKQHGALHITKRGPGTARQYLYLAALRLIMSDAVVRAWYAKKVARDGGLKQKALVAVMRKLTRALWHVARGQTFDARKLFDVTRLNVQLANAGLEAPM